MLELQGRDRELLRVCAEQQFLTLGQVRSFFSGSQLKRSARRRVAALRAAGLIRWCESPLGERQPILRVTSKGLSLAEDAGAALVKPRRHLPAATFIHDALVTSVRLRLQTFWKATFIPECAIREGEFPVIPDGVFAFTSGVAIALEVENSLKHKKRFVRLAQRWKDADSILAVLYVAKDETLRARLQSFITSAGVNKPLGLVSWTSLSCGQPEIWTVRGPMRWLHQKEFG